MTTKTEWSITLRANIFVRSFNDDERKKNIEQVQTSGNADKKTTKIIFVRAVNNFCIYSNCGKRIKHVFFLQLL